MESTERVIGNRYRLLARLGSGATGHVWRGQDLLLRREVAVKEVVLAPGTRQEEAEVLIERTRREARSAARLHHPSVVAVYDVVDDDSRPWLVMELVEARTLAEVVAADGPLTPARTAQVGLALLGALEAAHARGIVHRDVKPGNVLLCAPERGDGRVVLTDFGIATTEGDPGLTSTGILVGSPAYIAPERARGQVPGHASDLWSLGATLFTAVEGALPYGGRDALETVTAVVTGAHSPFVNAGPLVHVLAGLLEKDPALRTSAADTRALLGRVAHAPATPAVRHPVEAPPARAPVAAPVRAPASARAPAPAPSRAPVRRRPSDRRTSRGALLVATVALLAVAAGGWAVSTQIGGPPRTFLAAPPLPAAPATDSDGSPTSPAGWRDYTDPTGWSVALPAGFVSEPRKPGEVNLRSDNLGASLRVYVSQARQDPLRTVEALATGRADQLADYDEIASRRVKATGRGEQAAVHEFTWTARDGTPLRVLDRVMVVDGVQYELYWQTRARDWGTTRTIFDQALTTFRPAPKA